MDTESLGRQVGIQDGLIRRPSERRSTSVDYRLEPNLPGYLRANPIPQWSLKTPCRGTNNTTASPPFTPTCLAYSTHIAVQLTGYTSGCLAIIGWNSLIRGNAPWQHIVADITHSWESRIASTRTDPVAERPGSGPEHNRLVLEDFGFVDVASHEFPHTRERTVESIIGWLFSTSRFSERVWGENARAFEEEIRTALLEHDDGAIYVEDVQCGYTFGRRAL